MTILRIESITVGVEDVAAATRFCTDWGLELLDAGSSGATFRTLTNQHLRIVAAGDTGLPPPPTTDTAVREVTWGVSTDAAVEAIAAELSRDREVTAIGGSIRTRDETGYTIGFRQSEATLVPPSPRLHNVDGRIERWNAFLEARGRVQPSQICHVVFDLPKEGRDEAIAFYTDRLGFKPTDIVVPTGAFLQCEGNIDHHQLFLCHRTDRPGLNHISFEMRDFDEVIEGGNYMVSQGWKEVRRLGRHTIGSNLFRFFASPLGCRFEYATDMDKVEKSFPTRVWETPPPHHMWMIKTNADD